MTLEVVHRHEKLAPESGVEFMAIVSWAYVGGHSEVIMFIGDME